MKHNEHENHHEMHHDHSKMEGHNHEDMEMHNHAGMSEHDHASMDGHDHASMSGHDHMHHGNFKKTFFISLIFGLPILVLSPMMGVDLFFQFQFPGSDWLVALLATVLFFYGGAPFLKGAKQELKTKSPAMMTLIALGISVSYFYSIYAFIMNTFTHQVHIMDFFWELASLILIMLLGHWIEMDAVSNAGNALEKMAALLPSDATVVHENNHTMVVALNLVKEGDIVLVKAGENMPVDGVIIEGETNVNEAMITGESLTVKKRVGDSVIGGSVNEFGSIKVKVTGTGASGYLSQVMNLVSEASKDKSKAESMADVVAKWLFYIALSVGVLALIFWGVTTSLNTGIERMIAVLVIACPHALGLAIPLVTARSTSIAAQNGLLVKKRQALEIAPKLDMILMDKTGTLTEGNFKVMHIESLDNTLSDDTVLQYFASLESYSSHPLAVSIVEKAKESQLELLSLSDVHTVSGVGMDGIYDNKKLHIVNAAYMDKNHIEYSMEQFLDLTHHGYSVSYLLIDSKVTGVIAQGDEIKPGAAPMIERLHELGIEPVMLTGDNQQAAYAVAKKLGIKHVHAELLPEDKQRIVEDYQRSGKRVMMVGDGVNDAPSLVRANVGMAIGAGTDVAIDAADVILVKSDPQDILNFLKLATNTSRKMKQNLLWGAGYNFIAIPLAAGVLAGIGFIFSPALGAILMSLSTVIVAINAMFLKI